MYVLIEKIFRPDVESAAAFYQQVQPTVKAKEAGAWSDIF